jgi:predicted CoA-binding protein
MPDAFLPVRGLNARHPNAAAAFERLDYVAKDSERVFWGQGDVPNHRGCQRQNDDDRDLVVETRCVASRSHDLLINLGLAFG